MEKYPVYCAWCDKKKGIKTIVSWSTVEHSSSICDVCSAAMKREMALLHITGFFGCLNQRRNG